MASTHRHHRLPRPAQNRPTSIKLNRRLLLLSSVLILLVAFSFSSTRRNHFNLQILKSNLFHRFGELFLLRAKSRWIVTANRRPASPYCVLWMAPFLSGGGYSSEAWSYVLALHEHMKNPRFKLAIEQHGDLESLEFWEGLPQRARSLAFELHGTQCRPNETAVVCHSEPGAWHPPLFQTLPCPPNGYGDFMAVIGRTMFETDRVNPEHARRCNRMDAVWVPTGFHVSTFLASGVEPSRVLKVVQPVDVNFFNPSLYTPLDLASMGDLVLGAAAPRGERFGFLSIFKWEYRKGWDVLLKAYLQEFSMADGVALYLLTNPYHSDRDFGNKIVEFVVDSEIEKPGNGWAPVHVIDAHVAQADMPRIFKAADSFVLPSRGEGWGRPVVEAMAMSLPVIVTNWSGPTEYLTEENGYPLPVERMSEVLEGPFKCHLWAEPSVDKLRYLMRQVMGDVEEAKARGKKAREDMVNKFSPEIVSGIVTNQLQSILNTKN